MVNGATNAPLQPAFTARSNSFAASWPSASETWAMGDQAVFVLGAEIDDPAVVRPGVGERELKIFGLTLPGQPDARVQDGGAQPLAVQQRDPLFRVHRAERRRLDVGFLLEVRIELVAAATHAAEYGEGFDVEEF